MARCHQVGRGRSRLGDQERKRWFDRLPAKAEGKVTPAVWSLSRDSAGMMVRFQTDAKSIHARYTLSKTNLAMPHMPATGVSGLDLYARNDQGEWRWVQVTRPNSAKVEAVIISDLAPGLREYAAYLPLYNGIESLEIGVPAGAKFEGLRRARPSRSSSTAPPSRTARAHRAPAWCTRPSSAADWTAP